MFFVPYDFRDMPGKYQRCCSTQALFVTIPLVFLAMSQTFIRQRVLAIDEHVSQKDAEQMSTVEQMKHLRYVIHLR